MTIPVPDLRKNTLAVPGNIHALQRYSPGCPKSYAMVGRIERNPCFPGRAYVRAYSSSVGEKTVGTSATPEGDCLRRCTFLRSPGLMICSGFFWNFIMRGIRSGCPPAFCPDRKFSGVCVPEIFSGKNLKNFLPGRVVCGKIFQRGSGNSARELPSVIVTGLFSHLPKKCFTDEEWQMEHFAWRCKTIISAIGWCNRDGPG